MFKYLAKKLGIADLKEQVDRMPALNERYLKLLHSFECIFQVLEQEEPDDTQCMHWLRSMGYFGGWKVRNDYLKGQKHVIAQVKCRSCGCNTLELAQSTAMEEK